MTTALPDSEIPAGTNLCRRLAPPETSLPCPRELIDQIAAHRAQGWTLRRIASHLDATGVPTPKGQRWHPETVRTTLTRAVQES